jgi:hypothetical protein
VLVEVFHGFRVFVDVNSRVASQIMLCFYSISRSYSTP